MPFFLTLLLAAVMIAAVVVLVRGVIGFLRTGSQADADPATPGLRANRMMQASVLFQALALAIVVLLLLMVRKGS